MKPRIEDLESTLSMLEPGVPMGWSNVSWQDYEDYLKIIGDRHYRTSYGNGEYEILLRWYPHGIPTTILTQMIQMLTQELDEPIRSMGMTTICRNDRKVGLEPDQSFYLANELLVRCRLDLDFNVDPPPDLAIENEVPGSVEKRMRIYGALGFPEVWRISGETLTVNQLGQNEQYVVAQRSRFFPQVPLNVLVRHMKNWRRMGELELMLSFRDWVRHQIGTGWKGEER